MRLAPNDILFAHIALHVVPDLSPSARRVGAAIIEHFNKRTGQCDPSIERLGRLLGLSPTSVKAATAELCRGDSALFDRIVNGGHSHRTAYLPRWDRLNDIIADWDLRLKDGTAPSKGRKIGSLRAGKPAVEGPRNRPQTDRRNRQKEPRVQVEGLDDSGEIPHCSASQKRRNGLWNEASPERQGYLVYALPGGKGAAKADAAEAAEARRLAVRITKLPAHERKQAWLAAMGESP